MEENSFAVEMVKSERKKAKDWKKAFFVTLISAFITIGFIIGCGVWLWSQYDYSATDNKKVEENVNVNTSGNGNAYYNHIGNDGDAING